MFWYFLNFFIMALVRQNLRVVLIVPQMEEPINDISQLDFGKTLIALDFGKFIHY